MDETIKELENEAVTRYFDGISNGRCGGETQKKSDWRECKIILDEIKSQGVQLDEYLNAIYKRVS